MTGDSSSRQCSLCGYRLPHGLTELMCPQCLLNGALQDEADRDGDWRIMGEWRLIEELGRGGMGVVYRAEGPNGGAQVALKTISAGELATPELRRRFRVEARAAAALRHPNLVAILDTGEHEGVPFLVMTLVEGCTLADRLARGPVPPREAAVLMRDVADAVSFIHAAGILHRDLKPSNVLLDSEGKPWVTDFGLAKQMHGSSVSDFTRTGQVLGSPAYMPPEQARGENQRIGPSSDVYALGAILYHLLTGRAPFAGASMHELLQKVEMSDPLPARKLQPAIPRDLETICIHCMEKDPAARCPSARALADDLQRWMDGVPVTARRPGWLARRWRWCRRRPLIAGLAAATLLLLVSLGSYVFLTNLKSEETRKKEVVAERAKALAEARDAIVSVAPARRSRGIAAMKRAASMGATDDLQDTALSLLSISSFEPVSSAPVPQGAHALTFSPDLFHAAWSLNGKIHLVRTSDGGGILTFDETDSRKPGDGAPEFIEFSRPGGLIAVHSANGLVRVWQFTNFKADQKETPSNAGVKLLGKWQTMGSLKNGFHPVCTRGDESLALRMAPCTEFPNGALTLVNLEDGATRIILDGPNPEDFFLVNPVHPLCAVYHGGLLEIKNLGFLDVAATIPAPTRITRCVWQDHGDRILAGCASGNLILYSIYNNFSVPLSCLRHNSPVTKVGYAGLDLNIVSSGEDATTWVFTAVTNQVHLELRGVTGHSFSRAGDRLAAVDGEGRMLLWKREIPAGILKTEGVVTAKFESWDIDFAKKSRTVLMDSAQNLMARDFNGKYVGLMAREGRKRGASFTPDESGVLIMHEYGFGTLNLLSVPGVAEPLSFYLPVESDADWLPRRFCFGKNGVMAIEGTDNRYGTARWSDLKTIRELKGRTASNLEGPGGAPGGSGTMAVSPEGAWIAGGFPEAGPAVIWNAEAGEIVKELPHPGSVHFSQDGRWFLLGGENVWRLYTAGTWKEQWTLPRHGSSRQVAVSAFAADGRTVVLDTDPFKLALLETESGRILANFPLPEPVASTSVRFENEQECFYAGTRSNSIFRWDLKELRTALKALGVEPHF